MTTTLYPIFIESVNNAINQLINIQVTPWAFLNSGQPFHITTFDGRQINYKGIAFEGSPRQVFWSNYIEPFLKDICISQISTALVMAKERSVDAKHLLPEVQSLLIAGITKVFSRMADVDRRLRGSGFPDRVQLRSIDNEVQNMKKFVDELIRLELATRKPEHQERDMTEDTKVDHFIRKIKNHKLLASLVIIGLIVIAIGSFTESIDKILSFAEKRIGVSINSVNKDLRKLSTTSNTKSELTKKIDPNASSYSDAQAELGSAFNEVQKLTFSSDRDNGIKSIIRYGLKKNKPDAVFPYVEKLQFSADRDEARIVILNARTSRP